MSPVALQAGAGHSDMSTTQRYIDLAGVRFRDEAELAEARMFGSKWMSGAHRQARLRDSQPRIYPIVSYRGRQGDGSLRGRVIAVDPRKHRREEMRKFFIVVPRRSPRRSDHRHGVRSGRPCSNRQENGTQSKNASALGEPPRQSSRTASSWGATSSTQTDYDQIMNPGSRAALCTPPSATSPTAGEPGFRRALPGDGLTRTCAATPLREAKWAADWAAPRPGTGQNSRP